MRVAVTGAHGQVATSLIERAGPDVEIVTIARPTVALEDREAVLAAIAAARPDVVINAAAYTAVDKAESEQDLAMRVNGLGAGHVAEAAAGVGAPRRPHASHKVVEGARDPPTRAHPPTGPTGAYGRSKLEGERQVAALCGNSAILRTAWVYSPFGANFVKTMLRLNETRDEVGVVADQRGNPTSALDIADALLAIARRIRADKAPDLRGIFHMTGAGEASWADLAEAVFAEARARGRRDTRVKRIATADYPTPARRPTNSRLDNGRLARAYGVALPDWRGSVAACCARLLP